MKKYNVEIVTHGGYDDYIDNWIGDYIDAESEEEAIEIAKQWLIDNGYDDDVEALEYVIR